MTSIYLQLNNYKNNHTKFFTYTQESNTTSDKLEDKTKSSLIHQHNINNNKAYRDYYYLKRYENYFHKKLVIKYNVLPQEYNMIQMDNFIQAKYFRPLAKFKESLIYNDFVEFLKKYYKMKNIMNKIPLLTELYKSYLDFFCFPTFVEFKINELIEDMVENKAKMFYKKNYKEEEEKDEKEEKEENEGSKNKKNATIIFTEKIRKDLSRKNTLTDLSKTTIQNNKSDKGSINSILTINNILNFLNNKKNKSNLALKKEYFKNNLLKKKDNNEENSDKKDKSKNIIKFINNYALNRNNKININSIKNTINSKINNKKGIKKEKNNKNNITKNKLTNCQLNTKYKGLNFKIYGQKISNLSKNLIESKKFNTIGRNNKIEGNSKTKKDVKSRSKKVILSLYNNLKKNNIKEKNVECKTEREHRIKAPNVKKIHNKGIMDKKLQKFLKIALNFNKSPQKKKALLYKKINSKNSKMSLSDRYKSKSNRFKNKKRIKSNSNLSENVKYNKKISLKSLGNSSNGINSASRNYKIGFEEFKTTIIKSKLKNLKFKNAKIDCYNSSKKRLCSYNKFKLINRNSYFNNKTQKILRTSHNKISCFIKETSSLSRINNISHFLSRTNKKVVSNSKIINIKKSLLPISKLIIKTNGIPNIMSGH